MLVFKLALQATCMSPSQCGDFHKGKLPQIGILKCRRNIMGLTCRSLWPKKNPELIMVYE